MNNRGLLFNDLKRNHDAIVDFLVILEKLNPRYIDAWNNIAFAYNCVGEHEKAVQCATRALELKPRLAEPYRIRGYALYRLGRYEDAIADCNSAINLYGAGKLYAKAHYTRALACEALAMQLKEKPRHVYVIFPVNRTTAGDDNPILRLEALALDDKEKALSHTPNVAQEL